MLQNKKENLIIFLFPVEVLQFRKSFSGLELFSYTGYAILLSKLEKRTGKTGIRSMVRCIFSPFVEAHLHMFSVMQILRIVESVSCIVITDHENPSLDSVFLLLFQWKQSNSKNDVSSSAAELCFGSKA